MSELDDTTTVNKNTAIENKEMEFDPCNSLLIEFEDATKERINAESFLFNMQLKMDKEKKSTVPHLITGTLVTDKWLANSYFPKIRSLRYELSKVHITNISFNNPKENKDDTVKKEEYPDYIVYTFAAQGMNVMC